MKLKIKLMSVLLLSTMFLGVTSCDETSSSMGGNTSSTSGNNTGNNSEVVKTDTYKALETIRKGFTLEADYTIKSDNFHLAYTYQNENEEAFSRVIDKVYTTDDPSDRMKDETIFENEEGFAYDESLGLDNKVKNNVHKDLFNTKYINPFSLLNEHDFTLDKDNTYKVNVDKMTYILPLLTEKNFLVKEASVVLTNSQITSVSISGTSEETFNGQITYGNKINHLATKTEGEKQQLLSQAFVAMGNAFVVDIVDNSYGDHRKVYCTGNTIYLQENAEETEISMEDLWLNRYETDEGTGLYEYYYSSGVWEDNYSNEKIYAEEISRFDSLSGALFDFDETNGYSVTGSLGALVAKALMPKAYVNSVGYDELNVNVKLNQGKVSEVTISNDSDCDIVMTFTEYTKLPFGLIDEPFKV